MELSSTPGQQASTGSKVLVCSLDPRLRDALRTDSLVYSRHYQSVDAALFPSINDLIRALTKGYDIVHLFCPLALGGLLADESGETLLGSELIKKCCEKNVKLLWVANENKVDHYVKGFKPAGRPLNLIMTINRGGEKFAGFLDKLLSRISSGERLPNAWVALVPQAGGPFQEDFPSLIFSAGRANAQMLS